MVVRPPAARTVEKYSWVFCASDYHNKRIADPRQMSNIFSTIFRNRYISSSYKTISVVYDQEFKVYLDLCIG